METDLTISGYHFPPFSARGCTQELKPIRTGEVYRTINGKLVYTGEKIYQKYLSIITCKDQSPPSFANIWRGEEITLGCIQRLCQSVQFERDEGLEVSLNRTVVEGSIIVFNKKRKALPFTLLSPNSLRIEGQEDVLFISYRPLLNMRVLELKLETDEWGMVSSWQLTTEEV